uniref:Uncharacterized protein n=1 Tax=Plectus sambesii TaxID=2011161 RepID=A0A914WP67_9BILA
MSIIGSLIATLHCVFLLTVCQADAQSAKPVQQIIKEAIFQNYDKSIRPSKSVNAPIKVLLNPALYSFVSVSIAEQTLTFKQWFRMRWKDEFLTWNPAAYNGVTSIMVSRADVWLPDIMLLEATEIIQLDDEQYAVALQYDGSIATSVDQLVTVHCQFDVVDFPYDTQNCTLRYSSWMYDASYINPYPNNRTDLDAYCENDEWTLRSFTSRIKQMQADGMLFVEVAYDLKFTRKPPYYITSFFWPAFIITSMAIVGVFTPYSESGSRVEKVTFGLTALLTMAVILMIITSEMPKSSNGIPLLGIYVIIEIVVIAVATLFATLNLHLHKAWMSGTPVPSCLLAITCQYRSKTPKNPNAVELISAAQKAIDNAGLNININNMKSEELHEQWMRVTDRLDIMLLIIFFILNCIVTAVILLTGQAKLEK